MGASDDSPLGTSVCWAVSPLPVPHKDLPSRLWHVQHRHSQSVVNHNGGFTAASGYQSIRDEHDLKLQAIRHFNWDTHLYDETLGWQSCFISAFGDSRHAEKWGKRRVGQVTIYEIDVAKLPSSTVIFDAVKLCGDLAIAHPWAKNEFIFLHEIPGECVGHGFDLIGGQYYWQPKWPITYSPSELQRSLLLVFEMSNQANSITLQVHICRLDFPCWEQVHIRHLDHQCWELCPWDTQHPNSITL